MIVNRYTREIHNEQVNHYISGKEDKQFVVDIITVNEIDKATVQEIGRCSIPEDNLSDIVSFTNDDRIPGTDVTIVIWKFIGKSVSSLVLCRF